MIKISTYRQTYDIPFHLDYECNFGIYNRTDGSVILRFFRGVTGMPWSSDMNADTIFSFSPGRGMLYREPSLTVEMNEIFLDIIDMVQDEYNRLQEIATSYNYNDAHHNVFTEKMVKYFRDRKISSIVK